MIYNHSLFLLLCLVRTIDCVPLYPEMLSLPEITYESKSSNYSDDIARATVFLTHFDKKAEDYQLQSGLANWNYETDLTDEHLKKVIEVGEEISSFYLQNSVNASLIKTLDLPKHLSRQITLIKRTSEPPQKELRMDIKKLVGEMTKIYGAAKVQQHDKDGTAVNLTQAEFSKIFKSSRDAQELSWAWKSWRDTVGPPTKHHFSSLVDLLNIGAREHGWIDYGDYIRREYETSDLEESLDIVWSEIEPLYKELHAYVRHKFTKTYNVSSEGCIPASLLGDLFAQNWENIFHLIPPSESAKAFDVTSELKKQHYTVKRMFQLAESFFTSIGLDKMPETFWERSVLSRPSDKEMVCHASAWDVGKDDVRIKMCTDINQKDLTTIHHEMGHVEYFLAYKNQPTIFREGANPGFHEAIGDTISLSVETPAYLRKVGLLKNSKMQEDDKISFLLNQALRRIAPIPYNLLVDKWRWRVFEGNITEENYNKAWWNLRVKYQGVEPPVARPADAFDPASKYHIGANVPYIPYFVSYVLQFQLHKRLCALAGHKGSLHTCSIQNSKKAGSSLRNLMASGRRYPWSKLLQAFSGEKTLKADAILEYFQPLKDWLYSQRKQLKYPIGWTEKSSMEISSVVEDRFVNNEQPQERSGISKSTKENDQATLSFEIPPDTLKTLLKSVHLAAPAVAAENSTEDTNNGNNSTKDAQPTLLDLSKLLTPSNELAIKSTETSENNSNGHKEAIDINNNTQNQNKNTSTTKNEDDSPKSEGDSLKVVDDSFKNEGDPPKKNPNMISVDREALLSKLAGLLKNGNTAASNNQEDSADKPASNSTRQPPGIFDDGKIGGGGGGDGANQIALIPVSIPKQLSTALHSPLPSTTNDTSNKIGLLKNLGSVNSDNGNMNQPYDPNHTKNPSDDSKLYISPENMTTIESPTISREELLKHLKDSLLTKSTSSKTTPNNSGSIKPEKPDDNNKNFTNIKANEQNDRNLLVTKLLGALTEPSRNQSQQANSTWIGQNSDGKNKEFNKPGNKTATPSDINEEITSGLKKLLGLYNITNPTVAREKDGEKFIQTIESCKRFNENDPNCMYGKTITESSGVPVQHQKPGGVVDETKQTVSISPSFLMQKLMERKKAEESTPDAVVNNVEPTAKSGKATGSESSEATKSADAPRELKVENNANNDLDPNTLLTLLSAALGKSPTKTTSSSKRDHGNDATTPEEMSHVLSEKNNTWNVARNCSKLFKRGLTINFNCNNLLSNKTRLGLKGDSPLSTVDFIQKLLETKQMNDLARHSVPATRLQKTTNGFQVNFDLHVKDQIPTQVSGTLKTLSSGRQQHVNIFNTPEGVFMKPKSSVQLLRPSFVPVKQNHDNMELRKIETAMEKRFHIG